MSETQPQEERSLVISRGAELGLNEPLSVGILAAVHFSPQFPERLMRLNNALVFRTPRVSSVSLRMIPGQVPRIDAFASYRRGYVVDMEGFYSGSATLSIEALEKIGFTEWLLYMEDIQNFVAETFPDRKAYLEAKPNRLVEQKIEDFRMEASKITPEVMEALDEEHLLPSIYGGTRNSLLYDRGSFKVTLDEMRDPLFLLDLWQFWPNNEPPKVVAFFVRKVSFEGPTPEMERVLDAIPAHLLAPRNTYH